LRPSLAGISSSVQTLKRSGDQKNGVAFGGETSVAEIEIRLEAINANKIDELRPIQKADI
jgi:hypothetical protein